MYRRLVLLLFVTIVVCFEAISIDYTNLSENKSITVEIKGDVDNPGLFIVPLGSTMNDILSKISLKNKSDLSSFSLNEVLYNNQIINIPSKKNYELISINNASIDSLASLPGIGKSTALKIIQYRQTYGSFNSLVELKNVNGIGDKKYEKIKEYITL